MIKLIKAVFYFCVLAILYEAVVNFNLEKETLKNTVSEIEQHLKQTAHDFIVGERMHANRSLADTTRLLQQDTADFAQDLIE